jgi:hypothetical protein
MSSAAPLAAQLEQLRTHLETQIRSVGTIEQLLNELSSLPEPSRAAQIARIHTDLYQIALAGEMLSFLAKRARQALDDGLTEPE